MSSRILCFIVIVGFWAGCQPSQTTEPTPPNNDENRIKTNIQFVEMTDDSGVHFIPRNGQESGHYAILESLGTGIGISDYDRDGLLDILAVGGGIFDQSGIPVGAPTGLFRQMSHWKFDSVSEVSSINKQTYYSHGAIVGDWNSDGFSDYIISGYMGITAYENCGDGTFLDVTTTLEILPNSWCSSGAWGDFNSDGALDLYLVNYVEWTPELNAECLVRGHRDVCPPGSYQAKTDQIWWNNHDGTFYESGFEHGLQTGGKGLAVITGDIDLDGDTDVYVANDTTPNRLYLNNGVGTFVEQGLVSGSSLGMTAEAEGSMGVELADFNKDLIPDLWVSNYENQSFALYQGQAPGVFQHVSDVTGITAVGKVYVGFGTAALDADLDGDEDIFATNGHVMYHARNTDIHQPPLVFDNQEATRFVNVANLAGEYTNTPHMGRGLAVGDFDQNGRPDLVVSHTNAEISLLRNTSRTQGHWLTVELIGRASNRDAIGSYVIAKTNGISQMRFVRGGGSYLSTHAGQLYFGFPPDAESVELEIHWPDRQISQVTTSTNKVVRLIQKD